MHMAGGALTVWPPAYVVGQSGPQAGGTLPPEPVQSGPGSDHPAGASGAHAKPGHFGSAQSMLPSPSSSTPFSQFSAPLDDELLDALLLDPPPVPPAPPEAGP